MKLSRLALVLPLVGIAAWVGSSLLRSDRSTPAETIARTRDRFENTDTDGRVLIRELDRIREDPRTLGDEQALTDLLLLRSEIFESVGDIASARNDVERVLTLYRQDDTALALRAAELEAAEGRVEDALARAMRLARRPGQAPEVWRTIGKLERLQAQEQLTTALRSVDEVLVGESAARVKSTLQELAARDPADRARRTLSDEVRAGLPGGELDLIKQVLDAAEVASVHNRSARAALANALGAGADVASARRMVELLHQAGRSELAADLAFAARLHPEIWKDEAVFEIALDVEVALGHLDNAAQMIKAWDWENRDPSAALCEKALQLLLAADDPKAMGGPMNVLRRMQSSSTTQIALFYQALQTARRATKSGETNQFASALKRWTDFLGAGDNLDPVPGGQALAFIERSKAKRALGNSQGELEDLLRALTPPLSAARDVWLSRVSADDYMRMADLSSDARNSGYRGPEERWTQAMSLAPERWQELFPRWAELGGLSLQRDSGYSFEEVMKSARGNRRSIPVMNVGPNTLFRVARGHLTDGKFEGALSVARQLLAEYPGLVPAWDVMIEAQLARGSRVQVVVDLINRLSLTGADAQATSYLSQVGEDALRPPQRLEWMRLDPAGMGARVLAQHALDRGQPLRALRALGSPPDERSAEPFDLRLVRTEALLELGLADQALATVAGLQQHPVVGNRALALQLVALLETGGDLTDVVGRLVERLSGDEPPLRQGLDAVDLLLTRGHTDLAGDLLSALDSRRETRSGAVLERMTLHGLLVGDRDEALDALARAEAFFEDGRVELRRLIVGIENRDWRQLPTLAVGARAALGDQVDPWLGAALLLIEERHSAGLEAAQAGLQNDPRSPQWALLHAVGPAPGAAGLRRRRCPRGDGGGPAGQHGCRPGSPRALGRGDRNRVRRLGAQRSDRVPGHA
ncbi:MAG: hypothetical protein O2816_03915 [Planctomycetota bacterium]|nr:hypothetical protein [Planctomycetota bacterium]